MIAIAYSVMYTITEVKQPHPRSIFGWVEGYHAKKSSIPEIHNRSTYQLHYHGRVQLTTKVFTKKDVVRESHWKERLSC